MFGFFVYIRDEAFDNGFDLYLPITFCKDPVLELEVLEKCRWVLVSSHGKYALGLLHGQRYMNFVVKPQATALMGSATSYLLQCGVILYPVEQVPTDLEK